LNKGTDIIPIKRNQQNVVGQDSLYASSVYDEVNKELLIKFVNYNSKAIDVIFQIDTKRKIATEGSKLTLANADLDLANSLEEPLKIKPQQAGIKLKGKSLTQTFAPYSFTVIKLPVK